MDRPQIVRLMSDYNQDQDKETLTEQEFSDAIKKWSREILKRQSTKQTEKALQLSSIDRVRLLDKKSSARGGGGGITVEHDDDDDDDDDDNKQSDKSPLVSDKKTKGKSKYHSVDDNEEERDKLINKQVNDDINNNIIDEKEKMLRDMWNELNMETTMDEEDEEEREEEYLHLSDTQLIIRALIQLGFGTFLCCIFSDPMVSVIGVFSDTIGVSSFFVSFIVTPIASNASEIYSSLLFANKKTKEGISMGFSALYGAACMNNTFVLCIFCALVFFRRLQWTFIAETLVILLTVIIVGINGMKQTVTVWQGFIVISLFPLSLVLVALLDPLLDDVTKC